MSKSTYYTASTEKKAALTKLISMDEKAATMLYGRIKDDKLPSQLVSTNQRKKTFEDAAFKTLEYLWLGSNKANWNIKLKAKAAYLVRTNEHDHPRLDMLFTYEENMEILREEECLIFKIKKPAEEKGTF